MVAVIGALVCMLVLGLLLNDVRPQGNIARATPHGVAAGLVVTAAAWIGWGRNAAVGVAAGYIVLASLAVAAYVVAVEPIPYAECGTLVEEFDNAACRAAADGKLVVGASAAGAAAMSALLAMKLRTADAAADKSKASARRFDTQHDDYEPRSGEPTTSHRDKRR